MFLDEVGKDCLRFMMLMRKNDAHLDFDLTKALEQTKDNPVFYVQYAHARVHSVQRKIKDYFEGVDLSPAALAKLDYSKALDVEDINLIKLVADFPRIIEQAASHYEPHRIAYYLYDLASLFHSLWNMG